jgi:hypothetical protein
VTLEGTFSGEGTFVKREGSRVGSIGRASIGTCTGGSARVLIPLTGEFLCSLARAKLSGTASVKALDGRTEILLILGVEDELSEREETEAESTGTLRPMTITAPATVGTRTVSNPNWLYELRVKEVLKAEENTERFTAQHENRHNVGMGADPDQLPAPRLQSHRAVVHTCRRRAPHAARAGRGGRRSCQRSTCSSRSCTIVRCRRASPGPPS